MIKKLYVLIVFCLIAILVGGFYILDNKTDTEIKTELSIQELREKHKDYINNSTFKNTLTWNKKKNQYL